MTCGIYKITNKINGKAYIGASKNIEKRFNEHQKHSKEISHIIKKQGIDNFTFEILEECSIEELPDKEREYIALYKTNITGYNSSKGGEHPYNTTGYYHVSKEIDHKSSQGYQWKYHYKINNTPKKIRRWNLDELKKEVLKRGLKWEVLDEEKAKLSDEENQKSLQEYNHPVLKPTGIFRVSKHIAPNYALGYSFEYRHTNNGEQIYVASGVLRLLEQRVKCAGYEWKILDEKIAKQTLDTNEKDLKNINYAPFKNNTGVFRVYKKKNKRSSKGFIYQYGFKDEINNKKKTINSVDMNILEGKIKANNLPWVVIDEDKFKRTLEEDKRVTREFKKSKKMKESSNQTTLI